jgi:hypothetical protein
MLGAVKIALGLWIQIGFRLAFLSPGVSSKLEPFLLNFDGSRHFVFDNLISLFSGMRPWIRGLLFKYKFWLANYKFCFYY